MANFQIKDLSSDSNPLGTDLFLKSSENGALTKITFSDFKESLQGKTNNALAIVASGNTHAAISAGQYVYVKNHGSLTEGLYTANSSIGTNAALSSSNLTAVSSGGFNKLKGDIDSLSSNMYTWKLHSTFALNSDGETNITFPANAKEYAIRIGTLPEMLILSTALSSLASGWIEIGSYAGKAVTGYNTNANSITPIAFRGSDGTTPAYAGKTLYVYYR